MATQSLPSTFRPAARLQESALANHEKRLLIWMAQHTPACINSDHLTAVGFAIAALGVIYGVWVFLIGIGLLAAGVFGFVFQFQERNG